jgi:outer membrane protein assembly factor BamB
MNAILIVAFIINPWPMFHHDIRHTGKVTFPTETIYIGSYDSCLYAVDKNGIEKWKHKTGDVIQSSPIVRGGVVYCGSNDSCFYAVTTSGTPVWACSTHHTKCVSTAAIHGDSVIYFASMGYRGDWRGRVHAIYTDGTIKWTRKLEASGSWVVASPAIHPTTGEIVLNDYANVAGGGVYTLYTSDGSNHHTWHVLLDEEDWGGSPAIDSLTGNIYTAGQKDYAKLVALTSSLSKLWDYAVETPSSSNGISSSACLDASGTIYIGSRSHTCVYAITPAGGLKWKCMLGGATRSSPAIDGDSVIYIGCYDDCLYAIYASTGAVKWTYGTGGSVTSSPAIDGDGIVYVGSADSCLYAIHADGTLKWSFKTGGPINYSSPALDSIVPNGMEEASSGRNPVLYSISPNPSYGQTWITYDILRNSGVTLTVHNSAGQVIRILTNEDKEPGKHTEAFDARALPSGIYFAKLQVDDHQCCQKIILTK